MRHVRNVPTKAGVAAIFVGTCPRCHRESTFQQSDANNCEGAGDEFGPRPAMTVFASCQACTRSVLIELYVGEAPPTVIPAAKRGFPDPDYTRDVPPAIRRVLDETYAAESQKAWTLVGIGCRATMERMAVHHGVTEGMLGKKLAVMREKFPGLAGPLENAELVKLIGNVAAHDAAYDLSEQEAAAAIEFVEEVLRDVFILTARRKRIADSLPKKDKAKQ